MFTIMQSNNGTIIQIRVHWMFLCFEGYIVEVSEKVLLSKLSICVPWTLFKRAVGGKRISPMIDYPNAVGGTTTQCWEWTCIIVMAPYLANSHFYSFFYGRGCFLEHLLSTFIRLGPFCCCLIPLSLHFPMD